MSPLARPPAASLATIVQAGREACAARQSTVPLRELQARVPDCPATRGFARALRAAPGPLAVIAEIKQASPSGGLLRADFDARAIARAYESAGASALSVLTEARHFGGTLQRLDEVRSCVGLPLLQKDFVVSPYQVYEARCFGADAVLLIAAILGDAELASLAALASSLDLDVLLEIHDERELERALAVPTPMLGINNRNLATYQIDLATTPRLIGALGDRGAGRLIVSESGLRGATDVAGIAAAGARAVLVGEALMRRNDVGQAYAALFGGGHAPAH